MRLYYSEIISFVFIWNFSLPGPSVYPFITSGAFLYWRHLLEYALNLQESPWSDCRHEYFLFALELLKHQDKFNTTAAFWVDHKWNTEWQKNTSRLHKFISSPGPSPSKMTLPRPYWVRLNRLRIGVGVFS